MLEHVLIAQRAPRDVHGKAMFRCVLISSKHRTTRVVVFVLLEAFSSLSYCLRRLLICPLESYCGPIQSASISLDNSFTRGSMVR